MEVEGRQQHPPLGVGQESTRSMPSRGRYIIFLFVHKLHVVLFKHASN